MASFNELIKNYEKIRDYLREFHIYGYKCRNDYDKKSSRSYDNEKRRIENYLPEYIRYSICPRGKKIYISADTIDLEENPLFVTWMTKTFTKNDVMLHFIILDILESQETMTLSEINNRIIDNYLSRFDNINIPDSMTIRNKIKEYIKLGMLCSEKEGKLYKYYINTQGYPQLSGDISKKLLHVCGYYQNIFPVGVIGNYIRKRVEGLIISEPIFSFRHVYIAHTLDDQVLLNMLKAIKAHKIIKFTSGNMKNKRNSVEAIPLRILDNVSTGRRYLAAYNINDNCISTYRIDNIKNVKSMKSTDRYDEYNRQLEEILSKSWGITIYKERLDKVEVILNIDEQKEKYMIRRINREGKHGVINRINKNTFLYSVEVVDATEMVPWLRTLIGRMISFECSNKTIEKNFHNDIYSIYELYKEEDYV